MDSRPLRKKAALVESSTVSWIDPRVTAVQQAWKANGPGGAREWTAA